MTRLAIPNTPPKARPTRWSFTLGAGGPSAPYKRHRPVRDAELAGRADQVLTTHVAPLGLENDVHLLCSRFHVTTSYVVALSLALGLDDYRQQAARRPGRPRRGATLKTMVSRPLAKRVSAVARAVATSTSVVVAGAVAAGIHRAHRRLEADPPSWATS